MQSYRDDTKSVVQDEWRIRFRLRSQAPTSRRRRRRALQLSFLTFTSFYQATPRPSRATSISRRWTPRQPSPSEGPRTQPERCKRALAPQPSESLALGWLPRNRTTSLVYSTIVDLPCPSALPPARAVTSSRLRKLEQEQHSARLRDARLAQATVAAMLLDHLVVNSLGLGPSARPLGAKVSLSTTTTPRRPARLPLAMRAVDKDQEGLAIS